MAIPDSASTIRLIYHGRLVHSPSERRGEGEAIECLSNHVLAVDETGLIAHLEPAESPASRRLLQHAASNPDDGVEMLDYSDKHTAFLLPGFIDTHLHAPQYLYTGTALDEPLMVWLEKYTFQAESRIDKDPHGLGQKVYTRLAQRLIENGTTMAALYGTITVEANLVLAESFQEAGLRALVGKINMDQNSPDYYSESTSESLAATRAFIDRMQALTSTTATTGSTNSPHQTLVHPCITPRFVPTCSKELLEGLAEMAKEQDLDVQSHLSESNDEIAFAQSIWGEDRDDASIFDQVGLLTEKSLFAHCTHVTPDNLALLRERGSSVASCPLSNVYFSSKPFPIREAIDMDLKVGLGSDISGGYAIDLMNSMRWAVGASKIRQGQQVEASKRHGSGSGKRLDINWKDAIYLATLGGARALNRSHVIGNFQVGKSFDCQLIHVDSDDGNDRGSTLDLFEDSYLETAGKIPFEILLEKWWCNGTKADRKRVYVAGRRLM